jgi:hypothetical protein
MAELGAVASVVALAGAGAKLSIALFDFVSDVSGAAEEITGLAIEISQFCVVLNQVESALAKSKKCVRYSLTALAAIEQITNQCRPVLNNIEEILDKLKKDRMEPNFVGRIIWLLKRPRVQILQKTLESSKLTLSCMLTTLLFGETLANRRHGSLRSLKMSVSLTIPAVHQQKRLDKMKHDSKQCHGVR